MYPPSLRPLTHDAEQPRVKDSSSNLSAYLYVLAGLNATLLPAQCFYDIFRLLQVMRTISTAKQNKNSHIMLIKQTQPRVNANMFATFARYS